jgi:hypothetical protein
MEIKQSIPPGLAPARCKGCGAKIYWLETVNGKKMPTNPDGITHFATCARAAEFRRQKKAERQGELFAEKDGVS